MKTAIRIMVLVMVASLLLCAAGCGNGKGKKKAAGGTTVPAGTDQPVVEGVEDWEDTPNQQTAGQATTEQPTGQQSAEPTTGQQTGNQEQPDASKPLTLKEYEAMTTAQQQAYFESFPSPDDFYAWLEEAEKADEEQGNTVTGDGTLDLNDYINNNK